MKYYKLFKDKFECPKIMECLKVCGFKDPKDFRNFNLETIYDMERYIRAYCKSLTREGRMRFMDVPFVDFPTDFMIQPAMKLKIIDGAVHFESMLELCNMYVNAMGPELPEAAEQTNRRQNDGVVIEEYIELTADDKEEVESKHENREAGEVMVIEKPRPSLGSWIKGTEDENNFVIEDAAKLLVDCELKADRDFTLLRHAKDNSQGNFQCRMCRNDDDSLTVFRFKFSVGGRRMPQMGLIRSHLKSHFSTKADKTESRPLSKRTRGRQPRSSTAVVAVAQALDKAVAAETGDQSPGTAGSHAVVRKRNRGRPRVTVESDRTKRPRFTKMIEPKY